MKYNNLSELFKAISDAIRSKTGSTEPIIAEDFPEVIEGITTSGNSPEAELALKLWEERADATNLSYMFQDCTSLTTVPLFDTSKVVDMTSMFYGCTQLTAVPLFDTSKVTKMNSMFAYCQNLTTVPLFDTSKVTNMTTMFANCYQLTTVPLFDTRNVTGMSNMLGNCSKLTECYLRNIKTNLTVGSGTSYGHLLTLDSLIHLIKECRDTGSQKTLTVGSANLEKLANVYVRTIEVTDEMCAEDDLIDEKLPFEVCESTDEGAMLIVEYAAEKHWSVK